MSVTLAVLPVALLLVALFDCHYASNELALCEAGNKDNLPLCRDGSSHQKCEVGTCLGKGRACLPQFGVHSSQGSACPHESKVAATISVAAKSYTEVFVNGQYRGSTAGWRSVKTIATPLRKGDVVALVSRGQTQWPGLIVDITAGNTHHITGRPGWKAMEGNRRHRANPPGWMTKSYSSCQWPNAIRLVRPSQIYSRKPLASTLQQQAEYIWARGAPWHSTILLRYVIGGENCGSTARTSNAKLTLAADNRAWVYVNGQCVGFIAHWSQVLLLRLNLKHADVIAIKAQATQEHHGVIADVLFQTTRLITGDAHWKVLIGSPLEKHNPTGWKTAEYSSCHWRAPVLRTPPYLALPRQARSFPYSGGARYVWGGNATTDDTILLRTVIGGEKCNHFCVPSKTFITLAADTSALLYVNGKYTAAVTNGQQVRKAHGRLKKGDVIAVVAEDIGNVSGVKVEINAGKELILSGERGWKVMRQPTREIHDTSEWMGREGTSCNWPAAVARKRKEEEEVAEKAQYIWAKGLGANETVVMRYVVGGERCTAGVRFSTGGRGWLFVNGRFMGVVGHADQVRVGGGGGLRDGDVVGIKGLDVGGLRGVIAEIKMGGRRVRTGDPGWKATSGWLVERRNPKGWRGRDGSSCRWRNASTIDYDERIVPRRVRRQLYEGGARYIWMQKGGRRIKDVILLRYVVGGENCGGNGANGFERDRRK